jgi:hypothetical protein
VHHARLATVSNVNDLETATYGDLYKRALEAQTPLDFARAAFVVFVRLAHNVERAADALDNIAELVEQGSDEQPPDEEPNT